MKGQLTTSPQNKILDQIRLDKTRLPELIEQFVRISKDGYAILDAEDRYIYINKTFAHWAYNSEPKTIIGRSFSECMLEAYQQEVGVHIATTNIYDWLADANERRWRKSFRSFEIDLRDGTWLLLTEQLIDDQFLFLHATEITEKKKLEKKLLVAQKHINIQLLSDELTNLPNRRSFNQKIGQEIDRANRESSQLTLVIFDLDFFKQVNDQYGHQAGDIVLQQIGKLLSMHLRPYDFAARIGGEEFALIFTGTPYKIVQIIVERIRIAIESFQFASEKSTIPVTASFGAAEFKPGDTMSSLFSIADKRLYEAKDCGRNRTVF